MMVFRFSIFFAFVVGVGLLYKELVIRQGKGRKDRVVYLTDKAVSAVRVYLAVRAIS